MIREVVEVQTPSTVRSGEYWQRKDIPFRLGTVVTLTEAFDQAYKRHSPVRGCDVRSDVDDAETNDVWRWCKCGWDRPNLQPTTNTGTPRECGYSITKGGDKVWLQPQVNELQQIDPFGGEPRNLTTL